MRRGAARRGALEPEIPKVRGSGGHSTLAHDQIDSRMSGIHQDGDWFAPVTHWRPSALRECPRLAGGQVSGRRGGDVHAPAVSPGQPGDGGSDGANGGLDAQATAEQFVARWRLGAALPANAETRPEMYPGGQRHEKHEADR